MPAAKIVYIVDDDIRVRRSIGFFLKTSEFDVEHFESGSDFLDAIDDLSPGCVLLDIRMAKVSGLQVLETMRDSGRTKLPVVVMTGHGDVVTAVSAMKLGACDFLEKPFEENVLLAILQRIFFQLESHDQAAHDRLEALARIQQLTGRETDVLRGLIKGLSNKALAFELILSVRTVEMHRAHMLDRLGVRTLPSAMRLAFNAGFV